MKIYEEFFFCKQLTKHYKPTANQQIKLQHFEYPKFKKKFQVFSLTEIIDKNVKINNCFPTNCHCEKWMMSNRLYTKQSGKCNWLAKKNLLCGVKSPGPYRDGDNSIGGLI